MLSLAAGESECRSAANPASSLFPDSAGKLFRPAGEWNAHPRSLMQPKTFNMVESLTPVSRHSPNGTTQAQSPLRQTGAPDFPAACATDGHHPFAVTFAVTPTHNPPNSSRSNGSSSAITWVAACAGNRSARGSDAADRPESVRFLRIRFTFKGSCEMPQRRRGINCGEEGTCNSLLRSRSTSLSPESPVHVHGDLFLTPADDSRFAIEHFIRLTTRGTG